ncbi:helix-turn-helix transcriptional regulator [Paenibacillus guangzhouensis]|uniref:helix-turn-helix transcriptional regulator n=1 Tax=Paenibacillus guangzhouensis TaxID=1473112 RepID=UPI00187B6A52|nr:AraC family transcriptional regulator [Paenibacillus guangzhouensis]
MLSFQAPTNQPAYLISNYLPFNLFQAHAYGNALFVSHWHDHVMEMIYVRKGRMQLFIGGFSYIGTEGDLFFIEEGEIHGAYLIEKEEVPEYHAILINKSILLAAESMHLVHEPLLHGKLSLPKIVQSGDEHYGYFKEAILHIAAELNAKKCGYELVIKSHLYQLVVTLIRAYGYVAADRPAERANRRKTEDLRDVMMFVEEHYGEAFTLKDISRIARMSPFHFCRTFKKITGQTFIEYVNLCRIRKGEEMIMNSSLPITQIAHRVGFNDINYFIRVFRKYRRCSPSEFRKQAAQSITRHSPSSTPSENERS